VKEGKVWDAKSNIRDMEHWTREKGGWQATYTDLFCTKAEFRGMFNHELLDKQRARFGCEEAFPEVYDKVCGFYTTAPVIPSSNAKPPSLLLLATTLLPPPTHHHHYYYPR
jgi:hypothetical protein